MMMDDLSFTACVIAVQSNYGEISDDPLHLGINVEHANLLGHCGERCFVVCLRWTSQLSLEEASNQFAVVEVLDADNEKGTCNQTLSNNIVLLHASTIFMKHYRLETASSQGFRVKVVSRPTAISRATLITHTDDAYKFLRRPEWTTEVLINACQKPVLIRIADIVNLCRMNSQYAGNITPNPFDVTVLECSPVEQGVLTSSTSLTVVKAIDLQSVSGSDGNVLIDFQKSLKPRSLLLYFPTLSAVASILMSHYLLRLNCRLFPLVIRSLIMASRILFSWTLQLKVQVLAQSPLKTVSSLDCKLDQFNTVFVKSRLLCQYAIPNFSWALMTLLGGGSTTSKTKQRCVQFCGIEQSATQLNLSVFGQLADDVCYITPLLWFNLNRHPSCFVQPNATVILRHFSRSRSANKEDRVAHFSCLPLYSRKVHVSLIRSPQCGAFVECDKALNKYFKTPRLICSGDIFCLHSSGGSSFTYFLVSQIEGDVKTISQGLLVDTTHSSLFQEGACKMHIPCNMEQYFLTTEPHVIWNSPMPIGFSEVYERLSKLTASYLKYSSLRKATLNSICLVGPKGSGKKILVSALSRQFNVHLCIINCLELIGKSAGASASRMLIVIENAISFAPCVILLQNVHLIGKDDSGLSESASRIVSAFRDALLRMKKLCEEFPFIIIGTTTDFNLLNPELAALFLYTIQLKVLNAENRSEVVQTLFCDLKCDLHMSLHDICQKTSGFVLSDFSTLVARTMAAGYRRVKNYSSNSSTSLEEEWNICLAGQRLLQCDVEKAFSELQNEVSNVIGAPKIPNIKWEDIGGLDDVKAEILDTVQLPLQHPELFLLGLQRSGVLLYGPPGTGKTLLAKAVATECALNFLSVKGPELINMYVGQSEENVRKIFDLARSASPCIIFFDELDSLAPNRGRSGDSGGVMDRLVAHLTFRAHLYRVQFLNSNTADDGYSVVSQLLSEIDGIHQTREVFVIGATNRPDLLDPALLRPGRFDKLLFVGIPTDPESRLKILKALTRKFILDADVCLMKILDLCPTNLTGADFYALCSDALLSAVSRNVQNLESGDETVQKQAVIVSLQDFSCALNNLTPSVSPEELVHYTNLIHKMKR